MEELSGPRGPLSQISVVPFSESTNTAVVEALDIDGQGWPHLSALVADHQTSGRGRSGRTWDTLQGAALTVTFVLRPTGIAHASYGWAPLVVGLGVIRALAAFGVEARLKWPNDVVIEFSSADAVPGWGTNRKVAGILCEVVGQAIVAGIGINVSQIESELPVPHATSLLEAGADSAARGTLLGVLAGEIRDAVSNWERDTGVQSVARQVADACDTIGRDVVVDIPGGAPVTGRATGLSEDGGLLVDVGEPEPRVILAGDVRVRARG